MVSRKFSEYQTSRGFRISYFLESQGHGQGQGQDPGKGTGLGQDHGHGHWNLDKVS